MDVPNRRESPRTDIPPSDQLDTWKEIAAHLKRSVRTVQRWEQCEGLPVHRHRHDKLGSIYAFRAELDTWWQTRGARLDETAETSAASIPAAILSSPPSEVARTRPRLTRLSLVVSAVVILVVAAAASLLTERREPSSSRSLTLRPWVLVAEFENLSGDPLLDGTLRYTMEQELAASPFVNVAPHERIEDALRLMKLPPDTAIDTALGREICLRDGGITALLTGRVERINAAYRVSVRMVMAVDGAAILSVNEQASGQTELLEAVRRHAIRIRGMLGEQLTGGEGPVKLEKVTTTSLRALQLYSQAMALMYQVPMKTGPALTLLTQAVKEDPDFASAYILAAWALRNERRGSDQFLPYAERAFELADNTTELERYFILGSYYQMRLKIEEAVSAYEALLKLQPNHYWALGNLAKLYQAIGREARAADLRARQAEIRPTHFWALFNLAEALFRHGDLPQARRYADRAAGLAAAQDSGELQNRVTWLQIFPACEAWLRNDVATAGRIAAELEQGLSGRGGTERDILTTNLAYFYLTLGQRRAAERMFARLPRAGGRYYHLAVAGLHDPTPDRIRLSLSELQEPKSAAAFFLGVPFLDPKLLRYAEPSLSAWARRADQPDSHLIRGQIALAKGRPAEAIALFESSVALREDRSGPQALVAWEGVANAWQSVGDVQQAIHVLEEASHERMRACLWPNASGPIWLRLRSRLADLYRRSGREQEARAIEAELRTLLRLADGDHPLAVRLQQFRASATTPLIAARP